MNIVEKQVIPAKVQFDEVESMLVRDFIKSKMGINLIHRATWSNRYLGDTIVFDVRYEKTNVRYDEHGIELYTKIEIVQFLTFEGGNQQEYREIPLSEVTSYFRSRGLLNGNLYNMKLPRE